MIRSWKIPVQSFSFVAALCGVAGCGGQNSAQEAVGQLPQSLLTRPNVVVNGTTGDFTGDGYADFADHLRSTGQFFVRANLKNGRFADKDTHWGTGTTYAVDGWDVMVGDFNGDHFADYADHEQSSGKFWVHLNNKDGTFAPYGVNWGQGQTLAGANLDVLVADFTGDGYADFADHDRSTGKFYVHENLKNGNFAPYGVNWGQGQTFAAAGWDVLVGDFNGDHYADYADREQSSGIFYMHLNNKNGTFSGYGMNWGQGTTAYGEETVGAPFAILVADFTGDGYTDIAYQDPSSGMFWVQENLKDGRFAPFAGGNIWGVGEGRPYWELLGRVWTPLTTPPPPPPPTTYTTTIVLNQQSVWDGYVPYAATAFTLPCSGCKLTSITDPAGAAVGLAFYGPTGTAADCGDSSKINLVLPGQKANLNFLYGTASPALPLKITACIYTSSALPPSALVTVTYTKP